MEEQALTNAITAVMTMQDPTSLKAVVAATGVIAAKEVAQVTAKGVFKFFRKLGKKLD